MNYLYIIFAILSLSVGHYIKMIRWSKFIIIYERAQKGNLLRSLSIGHVLNYFLPFHVGDVARIIMSGRKMKNGISFSLATVVVEHYIDIIVVSGIFLFLYSIGFSTSSYTILIYGMLVLLVIPLTYILVRWNKIPKIIIRRIASIFNDKLELKILYFAWSIISSFRDMYKRISIKIIILWTSLMWVSYLFSYWCMAECIQTLGIGYRLRDVFAMMFSSSSMNSLFFYADNGYGDYGIVSLYFCLYLLLPLAILYILSCRKKDYGEEKSRYINLLPQVNPHDKLNFLESFFGGYGAVNHMDFLEINKDISILQDFSAGSNATTMLCMNKDNIFYRKYSFGDDSEKLWQQIVWIESNKYKLPLQKIINIVHKKNLFCYDMTYNSSAIGFFQYIHSNPRENSWNILKNVLNDLNKNLYVETKNADCRTILEYIHDKVEKNLYRIFNSPLLKDLSKYDKLVINGVEYQNLKNYLSILSNGNLLNVFSNDTYTTIHGDLTIENIICDLSVSDWGGHNYYLIDPNVGNIHNSMFLDYGKLLQSLHGGYEFMMKTHKVSVNENHIDFTYIRSSSYDYLYDKLKNYIFEQFGEEGSKSIYYHEIVHWLRLMPYKLRKDKDRAAMFYAGLVEIVNNVSKEFHN